jgi:cyclopropane-fatty-acyl-phospholipid synthase
MQDGTPSRADEGKLLRRGRRVAQEGFGSPEHRPYAVRYWDGTVEPAGIQGNDSATLVIQGPSSLRAAFLPPSEFTLCKAYLRADLDVEGDLETVVHALRARARRRTSPSGIARLAFLSARLPRQPHRNNGEAKALARHPMSRRHSRKRDAAAIRHHYDVGNEFYRLWLDRESVYSCAYFGPGIEDLDAAQVAKLDRICRKLGLSPGERLLDIGCGWGGLIRHAAQCYGVAATGITLSPSQADLALKRISSDSLETRCSVEIRDYRDLPRTSAFDKASSVGMFEHVGRSQLAAYFTTVYRVLRPGGLFLNSGIVDLENARPTRFSARLRRALDRQGRFLARYIFPDGELLPLATIVEEAEAAGFEVRDVESNREHYMQTVRHWLRRLEARRREAVAIVGDTTFRAWRLYLAASADAFASGLIGEVEMVLQKP